MSIEPDESVGTESDPTKPEQGEELTETQKREADALKVEITMYSDGQLVIKPLQNISSRGLVDYIITKAKEEIFKSDVANLTAVKLADILTRSQKKKSDIYIPGQK